MMIRSQDKKTICSIGEIYTERCHEQRCGIFNLSAVGRLSLLGKYNSEARCLEILDEIQKMFSQYVEVRNGRVPFSFLDWPKVYEMPEK